MAAARKSPNPESKSESKPKASPKAAPSKAPKKPDSVAQPKATGTLQKTPVARKNAAGNSAAAPQKEIRPTETDTQVKSAKKVIEQKKSTRKAVPDKAEAKQKVLQEPAVTVVPKAAVAKAPEAATPISSTPPPVTSTPKPVVKIATLAPGHLEAALQAVKEGRAIELIFRDPESDPPRTFEPRQVIFDALTQAWFVWGWDRRYNAERHHRLDQMSEINLVDGPGRSAQGPYKEGTPANLIGGWLGGEPIHVKATLQKQWIFAVKQAPPAFPDFKIEEGEEGKATVSFVATDLRAIARWCLQFGEGIQVLEPQRLVDRVKQVGAAWVGKPVVAAPAPAPRPAPQPAPRPEHKPEYKSEHRREHGKERDESAKKGPRVEIRIEKL